MDGRNDTTRARIAGRLPLIAFLLLCVGLLAIFVVYPTYPNYDSYYALLWARELWDGHKPIFDAYRAPTEHPLSILFSMGLTPFGRGVDRILVLCAMASVAALAAGMYALGKATFNRWVGLVAGVLLVINWNLILLAVRGYLDVTYMALVVWAVVLEMRRHRRGWPVLLMLAAAGLLRPEAWVLVGLYALWMAWDPSFRAIFTVRGITWLAAGVTAPLIWVAVDTIVTGHPLFSLTHTSGLAEELGRTRGPLQMPYTTITFMKGIDGGALFAGGLVGLVAAVVIVPRRIVIPLLLLIAGVATFLMIGVGGFSVIDRYLLVPAVLLLVFAAFLLVGWTMLPDGFLRRWWSRLAVLAGIGVVIVGVTRVQPGSIDNDLTFRGNAHHDLVAVLDQPQVRRALRCGPLWTPNHKLVPDSRWVLDAPATKVLPRSMLRAAQFENDNGHPLPLHELSPDRRAALRAVPDAANGGQPTRGVLVIPTTRQALIRQAYVTVGDDVPFDAIPLAGFRRIATSTNYAIYAKC